MELKAVAQLQQQTTRSENKYRVRRWSLPPDHDIKDISALYRLKSSTAMWYILDNLLRIL